MKGQRSEICFLPNCGNSETRYTFPRNSDVPSMKKLLGMGIRYDAAVTGTPTKTE